MTTHTDSDTFDYAAKKARLDEILSALQQPDIDLDEALKLHERGSALAAELEQYLEKAEVEIRKKTAAAE